MAEPQTVRIPCRSKTRDRIRGLKTGAENYEDVLRRLLASYDTDGKEANQ